MKAAEKCFRALLCAMLLSVLMGSLRTAHAAEGPSTPEPLPDDTQLAQAQERGKKLRTRTAVVPEALLKYAAIFKIKGVRCGHQSFSLEDATSQGGVYRCTERFKLVMPWVKTESLEYTHELLLDADFSLLSGKQLCSSVVNVELKPRTETTTTVIRVCDGTLELSRREKIGERAEETLPPQSTRLLGVRPIPGNAVLAMAALARNEPAPLSGGINPFMVSTIYMGWSNSAFNIRSAWLSFEKGSGAEALRMSARYLDGELSEQGLLVEAPTAENWKNPAVWVLDEKMRVTRIPAASENFLTAEVVEFDKLDADAPLDREAIAAALLQITQDPAAPPASR